MRLILAVDAGGTRSRAAVFDSSGLCVGFGLAGAGNPTSAGIEGAASAIGAAAESAMRAVRDMETEDGCRAAIALAGEETAQFHDAVSRRLAPFGVSRVEVVPDLLGMFHSGTPAPDGYALISGTGAVAARVAGGALERTAGGAGWLLGDAGSGFWIGHRIARAVVADLDGSGPTTALTPLLLDELGLELREDRVNGSLRTVRQVVSRLYAERPVELARFASLVFTVSHDAVARRIIDGASAALVALLDAVRDDELGHGGESGARPPIVVGGSVLLDGMRLGREGDDTSGSSLDRHPLLADRAPIPASDGLLGAAVLAFRGGGVEVDAALVDRLRASLEAIRGSGRPPS